MTVDVNNKDLQFILFYRKGYNNYNMAAQWCCGCTRSPRTSKLRVYLYFVCKVHGVCCVLSVLKGFPLGTLTSSESPKSCNLR